MNPKGRWLRFRSFWIFPLLAVASIILGNRYTTHSHRSNLLWLVPLGLLLWTFLEYTLHRYIFHMESDGQHIKHHRQPADPAVILVQPELAILISAALASIVQLITHNYSFTAGIMAGIWAGFLYYESVHYRVHVGDASRLWIANQRRLHFHHHFRNSKACFGVTTPIWDYIFRTTED
jgi:4-hydroxysphinganine ceramide fatty acyl 2-hydroxylase